MKKINLITTILTYSVTYSECHLIWNKPNNLNPVHGLFVKPSDDGSTGDLYVAATEDNGVESQWVADTSINFLPQSQPEPTSSDTTLSTQDESVAKEAVIRRPLKNIYALPVPRSEGCMLPYAIAALTSHASPYFQTAQLPLQYLYPQMMSAISSALSSINEASDKQEKRTYQEVQILPNFFPYPRYLVMKPRLSDSSQKDTDSSLETTSNETS